jgi:anti-sigma factor RsiW
MSADSKSKALQLQAFVDGELGAREREQVEALLSRDPEAASLVQALTGLRSLLKDGEAVVRMPISREFNWSQIQRQIEAQGTVEARGAAVGSRVVRPTLVEWLRWAVPCLGVGALAVFLVTTQFSGGTARPDAVLGLNHEVETEAGDTVAFTFRAESAGMSIVWVDGHHDF